MNYSARMIPFTKASACGNDFLIVEGAAASTDLAALTQRMCNRHNGVGADGVEWVFPDAEANARILLFNADGSEAEISGNGTRCVAAYLHSRQAKPELTIRTAAGVKTCRLVRHQGATFEFETAMGRPEVLGTASIPIASAAFSGAVEGMKVSTGNPHFVMFVESFPADWRERAADIQRQPQFPQGTNVEYVAVRGANEIEIRLYERGVGETQSSGTGSCASAVAAIAAKRAASPVRVVAPGGAQRVRWEDEVFLLGPATLVCRGEFFV